MNRWALSHAVFGRPCGSLERTKTSFVNRTWRLRDQSSIVSSVWGGRDDFRVIQPDVRESLWGGLKTQFNRQFFWSNFLFLFFLAFHYKKLLNLNHVMHIIIRWHHVWYFFGADPWCLLANSPIFAVLWCGSTFCKVCTVTRFILSSKASVQFLCEQATEIHSNVIAF